MDVQHALHVCDVIRTRRVSYTRLCQEAMLPTCRQKICDGGCGWCPAAPEAPPRGRHADGLLRHGTGLLHASYSVVRSGPASHEPGTPRRAGICPQARLSPRSEAARLFSFPPLNQTGGSEGPAGRLRLPIFRVRKLLPGLGGSIHCHTTHSDNTTSEWTQDLAGTGPVPSVGRSVKSLSTRLRPVVED